MALPPRIDNPPSWQRVWCLGLAHGVALFLAYLGARWLAVHATGPAFFLVVLILVVIGLFAALVAWFPYLRVIIIAAWVSPMTACALSLTFVQAPSLEMSEAVIALVGATILGCLINLTASAAMLPILNGLGRLPVHDPTKCAKCGYLLRDLESSRCPECGTPIPSPTPHA